MSWFKLPENLAKLKDDVTSFATEVLAPDPNEDESGDSVNPVKKWSDAEKKIEELSSLCATQDSEIAVLRKQVAELQQQQHIKSIETSISGLSKPNTISGSNANLEDSWFWEPEEEKTSSASSSKKDENESPTASDLTNIPLDERQERDQKYKKIAIENALLNEKLKQLISENRDLNEKLEELDRVNSVAIEEVLKQRNAEAEKHRGQEGEYQATSIRQREIIKEKELQLLTLQADFEELKEEFSKLQSRGDRKEEIAIMKSELERLVLENVELRTAMSEQGPSDQAIRNLQDEVMAVCIENSKYKEDLETACREKEEMFAELCERKKSLDEFTERFEGDMDKMRYMEELEAENRQLKERMSSGNFDSMKALLKRHFQFESTSEGEDFFDEFLETTKDVTSKLKAAEKRNSDVSHELNVLKEAYQALENEKDALKADLLNYEVECSELAKNNDILVMEVETLKSTKLETIPEQNEDIEILEQQLEDCSNSKQNLEEDFKQVQSRLDDYDVEKGNLLHRIEALEDAMRVSESKRRDLELYIEGLEIEKSNLLFEINELKAGDSATASSVDTNERVQDLEDQLHIANRDNQELLGKLKATQMQVLEAGSTISSLQAQVEERGNMAQSHEREIEKLREHVRNLQRDLKATVDDFLDQRDRLQAELATVSRVRAAQDAENANETTDTQQLGELRWQLEEKCRVEGSLRNDIEEVSREKADLAALCESRLEEIRALEGKLTLAAQSLTALESVFKEKDELGALLGSRSAEIQQLQETLGALNHEKHQLLLALEESQAKIAALTADNESLSRFLQAEAEKSTSFAHRIDELERTQTAKSSQEMEKINDQMHFLREKADILTANLMTEQNNLKKMEKEKSELVEKSNSLTKDLERLRQHLLEVEEAHTAETMELQKVIDEGKMKVAHMEEQVKQSSTAYTSANIRANQQLETLQTQYGLIVQQRDELMAKLSTAEDREQKNQAALTNLQCVLEQFQRDNNVNIDEATFKLRKEMEQGQQRETRLAHEIQSLQQQLAEAKNGLLAATRLSDQLESSQMTVAQLKLELAKASEKYLALETKTRESEQNQADKVEKPLVKNMLIGYVTAPSASDKQQILKLLSAVLDLNQEELAKVGLVKQSGWLTGFMGGTQGGPQPGTYNKDSLAQAFVQFLQKESQPKAEDVDLLSLQKEEAPEALPADLTPKEKPTVAVQPILLNEGVLQQAFLPPRNSSAILKDILNDS